MAILQRTPPARRLVAGADPEPETSSPSRSRLIRSSERQTDSYVFPSLEAMAAERQAAMALAPRNSPALSMALKARSSVEGSGGSMGNSSATGRKILGGQVGRNGPVLSATVAKTHPPIGSPRTVPQSSIPRRMASPVKVATADRRSQSPADVFRPDANDTTAREIRSPAAASRDVKQESALAMTTERSEFEAQMERALASGADPFQDRKRDLMRGESRIPVVRQERGMVHSPRRVDAIASKSSGSELQSPPAKLSTPKATTPKGSTPKASTARAAFPESPLLRTKTHAVQLIVQSPASQSSREVVLKLKGQIKEGRSRLEEAQFEAANALQALKEKEKLDRQQRDKIKSLERRLLDHNSSSLERDSSQLRLVALEWEFLREKCQNKMIRDEESIEREVEAIISRNEVTYMDARREESELNLKLVQMEKSAVEKMLNRANEQHRMLRENLKDAEREKSKADRDLEAIQSSKIELEEALEAERSTREDLERGIKELEDRLAKEEMETRRLKQRQLSSPVRKEVPLAARQKSSPARRMETSDKENVSPSKGQAASSSKATRVVSETVRQSPRKKLSAFVRSTSAMIQSTVRRQSDGMSQDEQENDEYEEVVVMKKAKAVTKGKQAGLKAKRKEPVSEEVLENSDEEVEKEAAVVPKKKAGILSRAKITSDKSVAPISSKRKSDSRDDEAKMTEMERDVQKTPMIPAKKKKGKAEIVRAAKGDESLEDVDATPIIKPRAKQQAAAKLFEDTTKTPMLLSKKRKEDVQSGETLTDNLKSVEDEPKKKRKRILKQSTNVATNFFNPNGDAEGALDPELNLPLQLSPCKKDQPSTSTALGSRGAAASRIFGR